MAHHLSGCVLVPQFAVQVALRQHPIASAVPLVIASGLSDRAVVVDVSTHATQRGVRPGMYVFEARRRAPALHVRVTDAHAMEQAIVHIEAALACHADGVRRVASGCWTLPLYGLGSGFAQAEDVARQLREDIRAQTGFACVLGLARQPAIARLAATAAEHGSGYCMVRPGDEQAFLAPLPVRGLPGVGERTEAALGRLGITTVGQLARVEHAFLHTICGSRAHQLVRAARGLIVEQAATATTSITRRWQSGDEPGNNPHRLRARVYALASDAGRVLRAQGQAAGAVTVHVTWSDGTSGHHAIHRHRRSDLDRELAAAGRAALDVLLHGRRLSVMELAVTVGDLGAIQQDLLAVDDSRSRRLQQALDRITGRYGAGSIQPGSLLGLVEPARRAML